MFSLCVEPSYNFRWETALPLDGPIYESAVKHLKSKLFCEKAEKLGADVLGTEIREAILKPFRWNLSVFKQNTSSNIVYSYRGPTDNGSSIGSRGPHLLNTSYEYPIPTQERISGQPEEAFYNHGEIRTEAESSTFGTSRNSINALLNPAEPTQSQQLSPVGSSSIATSSGARLSGYEQISTVGEHAEFGSSRGEKRGLESQVEADGLANKRGRVDTIRSHDSSFSQPSNGLAEM